MIQAEPYDDGLLDVGDEQRVHWEDCGRRSRMRDPLDLTYHGLVLFDQHSMTG